MKLRSITIEPLSYLLTTPILSIKSLTLNALGNICGFLLNAANRKHYNIRVCDQPRSRPSQLKLPLGYSPVCGPEPGVTAKLHWVTMGGPGGEG